MMLPAIDRARAPSFKFTGMALPSGPLLSFPTPAMLGRGLFSTVCRPRPMLTCVGRPRFSHSTAAYTDAITTKPQNSSSSLFGSKPRRPRPGGIYDETQRARRPPPRPLPNADHLSKLAQRLVTLQKAFEAKQLLGAAGNPAAPKPSSGVPAAEHDGSVSELVAKVKDAFREEGFDSIAARDWSALLSYWRRSRVQHRLSNALFLLRLMQMLNVPPDVWAFNKVLTIAADVGDLQTMDMIQEDLVKQGITPDAATFNICCAGHAMHGQLAHAIAAYREMRSRGILPLQSTAGLLISKARSDLPLMMALLQELRQSGVALGLAAPTIEPAAAQETSSLSPRMSSPVSPAPAPGGLRGSGKLSAETYHHVIHELGKNRRLLGEAKKVFEQMKADGVQTTLSVFTTLISLAGQHLDHEFMSTLVTTVQRSGMRLDLALVNAIIHSYAQLGDYRAADNFFRLMPTLHLKPDMVTFHSILLAFANSKEATKAHDVLRQMRSQGIRPDLSTYNLLMKLYLRRRRPAAIESLHQEVRRDGLSPDQGSYTLLLQAYSLSGQPGAAMTAYGKMKLAGMDINHRAFPHLSAWLLAEKSKQQRSVEEHQRLLEGELPTKRSAAEEEAEKTAKLQALTTEAEREDSFKAQDGDSAAVEASKSAAVSTAPQPPARKGRRARVPMTEKAAAEPAAAAATAPTSTSFEAPARRRGRKPASSKEPKSASSKHRESTAE